MRSVLLMSLVSSLLRSLYSVGDPLSPSRLEQAVQPSATVRNTSECRGIVTCLAPLVRNVHEFGISLSELPVLGGRVSAYF